MILTLCAHEELGIVDGPAAAAARIIATPALVVVSTRKVAKEGEVKVGLFRLFLALGNALAADNIDETLPEELILSLVDDSYALVLKGLTKAVRTLII